AKLVTRPHRNTESRCAVIHRGTAAIAAAVISWISRVVARRVIDAAIVRIVVGTGIVITGIVITIKRRIGMMVVKAGKITTMKRTVIKIPSAGMNVNGSSLSRAARHEG